MTIFSGFTANTPKHLQMDAGAFLKNYDITKDTWESAKGTKLIGATAGGGSFSAVPSIRKVEIDGVKGAVKGLQDIDEWVVTMTANVKEITADALKLALAAADSKDSQTPANYTHITARNQLKDEDYLQNLTWVGRLSGTNEPVIIVVKNALATNGLTISFADKAEGVIPVTITGHYDPANLEEVPFDIYYPKVS